MGNVTTLECKLKHRFDIEINHQNEGFGTIYQINTPHFFGCNTYPANTYCIWNVANEGFVSYWIMHQQLQNPTSDCDGPGCDCPDSMIVRMGDDELKLCGDYLPSSRYHISFDGLQLIFCSDNYYEAKGILLTAYPPNNQNEMTNNSAANMTVIKGMLDTF